MGFFLIVQSTHHAGMRRAREIALRHGKCNLADSKLTQAKCPGKRASVIDVRLKLDQVRAGNGYWMKNQISGDVVNYSG
jgi:hypothetical protein